MRLRSCTAKNHLGDVLLLLTSHYEKLSQHGIDLLHLLIFLRQLISLMVNFKCWFYYLELVNEFISRLTS